MHRACTTHATVAQAGASRWPPAEACAGQQPHGSLAAELGPLRLAFQVQEPLADVLLQRLRLHQRPTGACACHMVCETTAGGHT